MGVPTSCRRSCTEAAHTRGSVVSVRTQGAELSPLASCSAPVLKLGASSGSGSPATPSFVQASIPAVFQSLGVALGTPDQSHADPSLSRPDSCHLVRASACRAISKLVQVGAPAWKRQGRWALLPFHWSPVQQSPLYQQQQSNPGPTLAAPQRLGPQIPRAQESIATR